MNPFIDPVVAQDCTEFEVDEPLLRLALSNVMVTGSGGMLMGYLAGLIWRIQDSNGRKDLRLACVSQSGVTTLPRNANSITYPEAADWIRSYKPRIVVHGGSPADPSGFIDDPLGCLDANVLLTREIARACVDSGSILVFVSSGEVYGVNPPTPTGEHMFGELDHAVSRNVYAEAKRAGEAYVLAFGRQQGLDVRVIRLFHTFGPGVRLGDSRIFAGLIQAAIEGKAFGMRSDGTAIRSFLYSYDAMNGIAYCINHLPSLSVVNVASNVGWSVVDLSRLAMSAMVPELAPGIFRENDSIAGKFESKIPINIADNSLLTQTGWHPKVELSEAFRRTFESARWQLARQSTGG